MRCVTLSQLLWVPTVRIEKSGSVSVSHNDSADAIFIGCWTNISLPWKSPVKNKPAGGHQCDEAARDGRGPVHAPASSVSSARLWDRTISQALTAATKDTCGEQ